MAARHAELIRDCSPEHLRMVTAKMGLDKDTAEKVWDKSEYGMKYSKHEKKKSSVAFSYRPSGVATPRAVDELPNDPNLCYNLSTALWGIM